MCTCGVLLYFTSYRYSRTIGAYSENLNLLDFRKGKLGPGKYHHSLTKTVYVNIFNNSNSIHLNKPKGIFHTLYSQLRFKIHDLMDNWPIQMFTICFHSKVKGNNPLILAECIHGIIDRSFNICLRFIDFKAVTVQYT